MLRLQDFKASIHLDLARPGDEHPVNSTRSVDIKREIGLLIEAQDVCDELGILHKLLEEQSSTMSEMRRNS